MQCPSRVLRQNMIKPQSMDAKVTVIIPTYNRAQTLRRAIESVQSQSFKDWQMIVVDDGSTDETQSLLENILEPKLKVIKTQNKGVSHARNRAVKESQTQWIAFLDSDDEWLPEKLQSQMDLADKDKALQVIHGEEIWIRNGIRVNPMKKHQKNGGDIFFDSIKLCCMSPSTVVLKKSLLLEVGLFREDFPVCEDYDLWLKITSRYPVGFINQPIIKKYGGHEDQLSRQFVAMDYWRTKALYDLLENNPLSLDQKREVVYSIIERCEILLSGYRKHQNLENYDDVYEKLLTCQELALKI